ncbi:MAG: dephospho-CoA kinase [Pseudomonadota bacterium]
MMILGLTGSIGMGKTTVANWFAERGVPVSGSDEIVHALYAEDGAAVGPVAARFPGVAVDGAIDRQKLSTALAADAAGFGDLEAIVHPLVRDAQRTFLHDANASGAALALLDIPLLFETQGDARVDAVVVVACSDETQRERVLQRTDMTADKFEAIKARQMPTAEKLRLADFVIDTDLTLAESEAAVDRLVKALKGRLGSAFVRCWS